MLLGSSFRVLEETIGTWLLTPDRMVLWVSIKLYTCMVLSGFLSYIGFSSNCQLLIAPQYMVGPGEHLLIFAGVLTGLMLSLTVGNCSCCEFVVVIPMPVPEDDISQHPPHHQLFLLPCPWCSFSLSGIRCGLILVSHYRAEHPQSRILSPLTSYVFLFWLPPTAKRGVSDQSWE